MVVSEARRNVLVSRWNRLELIGFQAHATAMPESYGRATLNAVNPSWGPPWYQKVSERVERRKRQILEEVEEIAPRMQCTWEPGEIGTYATQAAVVKGREFDASHFPEDELPPEILTHVQEWSPLEDVLCESEMSCGFLLMPQKDVAIVLQRMEALGVEEPMVSDLWDDAAIYTMPAQFARNGGKPGWRLYQTEKRRVRLNTPEPDVEPPVLDAIREDLHNAMSALRRAADRLPSGHRLRQMLERQTKLLEEFL